MVVEDAKAAMTSFKWKRKAGDNVCRDAVTSFISDAKDDNDDQSLLPIDDIERTLLHPGKRLKVIALEDRIAKKTRLMEEGALLASSERYWEALKKWDEACQLCATDERLHEMRAQALLELQEVHPAIQAAERSVQLNPRWWIAYQTLGRAQLSVGEVNMAIKSFSKACHLNPSDNELWEEDLKWVCTLLQKSREVTNDNAADTNQENVIIHELGEPRDCCKMFGEAEQSSNMNSITKDVLAIDGMKTSKVTSQKHTWVKMKINN